MLKDKFKMATHARPKGHIFCLDHLKEEIRFICKTCKVPLCDECVASINVYHKDHEIESIKKHAQRKYNVLQDFENVVSNHTIPDIKGKANSAEKSFDDVAKVIHSHIKLTEDHGEYLKRLIDGHILSMKTEYTDILVRCTTHYARYKSGTSDTLKSLEKIMKESKEARTSDSNHLVVDVANDVTSREFSIAEYTKPKVPHFIFGSEPEKNIQKSFGFIAGMLMSTPEVKRKTTLISSPRSIVRTDDDHLIIAYATYHISIVNRSGHITDVKCDVLIWDMATHPTTGQFYCVHKDRQDVRLLNHKEGKTHILFKLQEQPYCLAVLQQGHFIIRDFTQKMIRIYTSEGIKLKTMDFEDNPFRITACKSSGNIAFACGGREVMVLDGNYKRLFTKTCNAYDMDFDSHGHLLVGDYDNRCVHVLNPFTGELIHTIPPGVIKAHVNCIVTQTNGELVVGTWGPDALLTIKYLL